MPLPDYVQTAADQKQSSGLPDYVQQAIAEQDKIEPGPAIPGESISTITGRPTTGQELRGGFNPDYAASESFVRPTLEAGGMIAGSLIGSGVGPEGTLAGAGLGYAGGKKVADILYEEPKGLVEESIQSAKDVATGAAMEATGQLIAPAFYAVKSGGKWVFNKISQPIKQVFSKVAVEQTAGDIFIANTSEGAIYAKNADEVAKIQKEIPGLKFTIGQKTNDPNLIKLERTQIRRPGLGAEASTEQIAKNNEALRKYYAKNFAGEENIDDLVKNLGRTREQLATGITQAEKSVMAKAEKIPVSEPEQTGQRIVENLRTGKQAAKTKAGELYGKIPQTKIDITDMLSEFKKIQQPMSRFEDKGNIPDLIGIVRNAFKDENLKKLSLEDLQGLRSELLSQSRQTRSAINPNERLASRLSRAADAVQKAIVSAESGSPELMAANKFYRKDYAEVFKQGTVGDILQPGVRGESTKIPLAKIPGKIWDNRNLTAADQFIKAAGDDATGIMRDHAGYDLLQKVTDSEGKVIRTKLNLWLSRNRPILKKFGMENDFNNLTKAQSVADEAVKSAAAYEKSVAGRILKADPDKAIAAAFTGKNQVKEARKLLRMVGQDKAAKAGLQKAYADFLMNKIQTTAKDIAGNPIVSNAQFQKLMRDSMPVMRVIYKDAPGKIKALNTMHKAYEIAVRNTKSPIGGGSDTAENILTELGKVNVLYRPATIARGILSIFKKHGDQKINDLITRAIFDPDYAQSLVKAAKAKNVSEMTTIIDNKIILLDEYKKQKLGQALGGAMAAQ